MSGQPDRPHHGDIFDVVTMGRIGVDIYPLEVGVPLERVHTFGKYLGGSATNVAVAAARLGQRTAVITRTGDDPFGRFLIHALDGFGVDHRFVTSVPGLPTPVTFCEIFPPDRFPIYFYRFPKAPDIELTLAQAELQAAQSARLFWCTLTGLSAEPSRRSTMDALASRGRAPLTVLDLDYRPTLWADTSQAPAQAAAAVALASVTVGNIDECEVAVGTRDPSEAGERLLAAGVSLAVVKMGERGVLARTATDEIIVPPHPVDVVNGLGAGDAFGGALAHTLLAGRPLDECLRWANAAGAIVASRLACSDAMPREDEILRQLEVAAR